MRAGGGGGGDGRDSGSRSDPVGAGWMAPFAQALQGLRPAAAAGSDDGGVDVGVGKKKAGAAKTGPLVAARGGGDGNGSRGREGSGSLLVKRKGGATLPPPQQPRPQRRRGETGVARRGAEEDDGLEVEEAEAGAGGVSKGLLAAGILLPTLLAVGVALYQSGAYSSVQGINIGEVFREVEAKVRG